MKLYSVTVNRIIFESQGFAILGIRKTHGCSVVKLSSNEIPKPLKTVKYDFEGEIKHDKKYGPQFVAWRFSRSEKQKPSDELRAIKEASVANKYI